MCNMGPYLLHIELCCTNRKGGVCVGYGCLRMTRDVSFFSQYFDVKHLNVFNSICFAICSESHVKLKKLYITYFDAGYNVRLAGI